MGAPQLIYLALAFVGLGLEIAKHGQPQTGRHNAGTSLVATGLVLSLLWWGGFFG